MYTYSVRKKRNVSFALHAYSPSVAFLCEAVGAAPVCLNAAHDARRPRCDVIVSLQDAFGLPSLFPVDWDRLVLRLLKDDALFSAFYR